VRIDEVHVRVPGLSGRGEPLDEALTLVLAGGEVDDQTRLELEIAGLRAGRAHVHDISKNSILFTYDGDVVLDPFMGSGVTGAVCRTMKRRCFGIEREERWYAIATQRTTS
jgi:16S rRNA G966 N2-methylase RsmD